MLIKVTSTERGIVSGDVEMQSAMNVVQISEEDQQQAFEMLSAVLWLGNITFSVVEQDNHVNVDENEGKLVLFLQSLFVKFLLFSLSL